MAPRRWLTLLAMTGSLSMIFIDTTVVGVALPSIRRDLGMDPTGQQWVVNAYILALASLVAIGGRAGDLIGRVRAFVIGVLIFTGASIACAMAAGAASLLAARAMQGVGAALMQPASGAIVVSSFAPGERGKAMAVYVGIPMLFMVIGPAVGGALAEISWRWCFWVNLPVAAIALLLTARARPANTRSGERSLDLLGALLLLTGLPSLVFGLQQANAWGWRSPLIVACITIGALLLVAFGAWEWRRRAPLLNLRLFTDRGLLGDGLLLFLLQFAMTGLVIYGSVYAQTVLGYAPFKAGASILPMMLPILFVVHVAGRLYDRVGVRLPAFLGALLATIGLAIQATGAAMTSYPVMAVGMVLFGSGVGFALSPTNTDALSRVDPAVRGQTSGLVQTMRQVGGTFGVAMVGATVLLVHSELFAARSATLHELTGITLDVPAELLTRALEGDSTAIDTIASGRPEVVRAFRDATAGSISAGYWVAASSCAAAVAVAGLLLRNQHARQPSHA